MKTDPNSSVIIIGTLDTKGEEVSYLSSQLQTNGIDAKIMDVGISGTPNAPHDFGREEIALRAGRQHASLITAGDDKVEAMRIMADGALSLVQELLAANEVVGVMALGGGVGTWIGMKVMRDLPFGLPKIMISTLPFDIRSDLGAKDIIIFPSVADILGLNPILRTVLHNAAGAMAGMVALEECKASTKKVIGITALGVTTPLVNHCKEILEQEGFEVAAFHGVGVGGKSFEQWVQTGMFSGILDLTPHDINNLLFGGITPFYSGRLESAADKKLPQVIAPGGLDFISRGPIDTLSAEDRKKKHYQHSPMFTHVRVSAAEMEIVAQEIAEKLNPGAGTTQVVIPLQGFSFQGRANGHLADHEADMTFVRLLKQQLLPTIPVVEVDAHINDELFAEVVCRQLLQMINNL